MHKACKTNTNDRCRTTKKEESWTVENNTHWTNDLVWRQLSRRLNPVIGYALGLGYYCQLQSDREGVFIVEQKLVCTRTHLVGTRPWSTSKSSIGCANRLEGANEWYIDTVLRARVSQDACFNSVSLRRCAEVCEGGRWWNSLGWWWCEMAMREGVEAVGRLATHVCMWPPVCEIESR